MTYEVPVVSTLKTQEEVDIELKRIAAQYPFDVDIRAVDATGLCFLTHGGTKE